MGLARASRGWFYADWQLGLRVLAGWTPFGQRFGHVGQLLDSLLEPFEDLEVQ